MSESPPVSLTRMFLPSRKATYSFDTPYLPSRFEGEGKLHTRSTLFDDERATSAYLSLEEKNSERKMETERTMHLNPPIQAGFDVIDNFDLTVTREIDGSEVPLDMVGEDHSFSLDYITADDNLTEDREADYVEFDGEVLEAPFELDFRSKMEFSKAWGPKRGDPLAEGTVQARKLENGTEIEYNIEGATLHYDTRIEDHMRDVMNEMGIDYDRVFSEYADLEL